MATTTFDNLITFSRGSNATVTGPNGLIQWAPSNVLTNSENFDASSWVKDGATITANATAAPDGSITAEKFVETATNATHQVYSGAITVAATATYTYSIYAKAGERNWLAVTPNDFTERYTWFNLAAGTIGTNAAGNTATITPVGNGWYRCTVTRTLSTTSTRAQYFVSNADNTPTYLGDGTSGIFIWGAQLELGSTATTYNNTSVRNLLGFSEAFDNAAWTKTRASMITGAQANPVNSLFNAQKLMEDTTASNTHVISQSVTFAAIPYTFSVYAKAAERSWLYLNLPGTTNAFASFNVSTGVVGTVGAAATASIRSVGSGWYICTLIATATAGANTVRLNLASADNTITYTGDGNSGVYIYGAMLSNSASLDPYVPTPGAAPSSTAYYGPRFDYDPVTLLPRGLLIEEQRTNLLLNSVFSGAVSGTPGTAPTSWGSFANGTITVTSLGRNFAANSIRIVTSSARHFYSQTVALSATGTWMVTFKVDVTTPRLLSELLAFNTFPAGATTQYFYNNVAQASSFVPPTGAGLLQVAITTTGTSGNAEIRFGCGVSTSGTADVTFWDAQWELGTFATSYIPTIASTVTRSADNATITGSLFSQWYRQPEGTLIAEFSGPSGGYPVNMTDGTNNNATGLVYLTGTTLRGITVVSGSGRFVDMTASASPAINKTAYGYRLNDLGGSTNGGTVLTNTTAPIPTLDRMFIGTFSNFSYLNGHIRSIRYVPVRAADFQLQQVTT